jgi:hypothetical protein
LRPPFGVSMTDASTDESKLAYSPAPVKVVPCNS